MSVDPKRAPRLPPRWFIRGAWSLHRAIYAVTGHRLGLRSATADHAGMLRLRTTGRRTGQERKAILGYLEDGSDFILTAMNGWSNPEPAWWLNLQAHPEATVDLANGSKPVRARLASGDERSRLWAKFSFAGRDIDRYAALRSGETAVVILEPRPDREQ